MHIPCDFALLILVCVLQRRQQQTRIPHVTTLEHPEKLDLQAIVCNNGKRHLWMVHLGVPDGIICLFGLLDPADISAEPKPVWTACA